MRAVYLEWIDAFCVVGDTWNTREEILAPTSNCYSCGFVLFEDEDKIVLVTSIDDDPEGRAAGNMTIPKRAVTKRVDIDLDRLQLGSES